MNTLSLAATPCETTSELEEDASFKQRNRQRSHPEIYSPALPKNPDALRMRFRMHECRIAFDGYQTAPDMGTIACISSV